MARDQATLGTRSLHSPDPERCKEPWSPSSLDGEASLERLERNKQTRDFLSSELSYSLSDSKPRSVAEQFDPHRHGISHITNQFEYLIAEIVQLPDRSSARARLEGLSTTTVGEELVRHQLLAGGRFDQIRDRLDSQLAEVDLTTEMKAAVDQIRWNDAYQFTEATPKRPLDKCLLNGVVVKVPYENQDALRVQTAGLTTGPVPILEHLKSEKLLEASGFMANKASLAIHDALDHIWLFKLAEDSGVLGKFADMWAAIGSPHETDLFKREGEAMASIGFGTRYWTNIDAGFIPIVTSTAIEKHMGELFQLGYLEERHLDAFRIVRDLASDPLSREAQSLGFVFSNYLVELDEQRRKHGEIKYRDTSTGVLLGELNPWSADYLSFFIEMHHLLASSKNKHRYTTFRINHAVEEFFFSGDAAAGVEYTINVGEHFYWEPDRTATSPRWTIPDERIHWIASNVGFTAIRDALRW